MAKVIITNSLKEQVYKQFKKDSIKIFNLMKALEKNPNKGKILSSVAGIIIKEIKYDSFRFYFITDGNKIKFSSIDELSSVVIKFIAMSDKKNQKEIITKVKNLLKTFGFDGF